MFYVSSIKDNLVGIMNTYGNVEEFYKPSQIKEIFKQVSIKKEVNLWVLL